MPKKRKKVLRKVNKELNDLYGLLKVMQIVNDCPDLMLRSDANRWLMTKVDLCSLYLIKDKQKDIYWDL